jgi:hypothetical protein
MMPIHQLWIPKYVNHFLITYLCFQSYLYYINYILLVFVFHDMRNMLGCTRYWADRTLRVVRPSWAARRRTNNCSLASCIVRLVGVFGVADLQNRNEAEDRSLQNQEPESKPKTEKPTFRFGSVRCFFGFGLKGPSPKDYCLSRG